MPPLPVIEHLRLFGVVLSDVRLRLDLWSGAFRRTTTFVSDLYSPKEAVAQGNDIRFVTPHQTSPSDPPAPRPSKFTLPPHPRNTNTARLKTL